MGEDIPGTFKGDMTERVTDQMNYSAGPDTTTIHFCTLLLFE